MTPRERLQQAYELAFYPPRLDETWRKIRRREVEDLDELVGLLKTALSLHLALPESGYSSQRALSRLAGYQAGARAFGNVTFLRNVLRHLGAETEFPVGTVPPGLIRDVGLPAMCHHPGAGSGRAERATRGEPGHGRRP